MIFDITQRKLAEEEIAFLAYHDKLTGLPNRALFEEMLESALARARRFDLGVGVLFLDLDNFKLVNDSLGHHAGDQLLIQLAERLRDCTRETDLVARLSGDEFLLLLADLERGAGALAGAPDAGLLIAESVAARVREALEQPFDLGGSEFFVSASIGISLYPQDASDAESLLRNADAAMYRSKEFERGGYVVYASSDDDPAHRLSFSTRLRQAVADRNWVLHYQPIIDLGDGTVDSVEALVRWQQPNGGLVAPGEFIPLAEEMGLIQAIGDWVLEELARQHAEWREQGVRVAIGYNLSPRQMWTAHLAEKLLAKLAMYDVEPEHVTIEITESTAMADPDRTQRLLTELHAWGFTLAIDDFGTGYSSLARLKHMPVDILKIDQAFVRHVEYDRDLAGHGPRHDPARAEPGHGPARGGDRDVRRVRVPPGERVPSGAGVPLRLPGSSRRDPRRSSAARAAWSSSLRRSADRARERLRSGRLPSDASPERPPSIGCDGGIGDGIRRRGRGGRSDP